MSEHLKFSASKKPGLEAGEYTLTATQSLVAAGVQQSYTVPSASFSVGGPRFELDPELVHSIYPPNGSVGRHYLTLPHIVFKRPTLPWERSVRGAGENLPWLALILIDQSEAAQCKIETITLKELRSRLPSDELTPEKADPEEQKIRVITLDAALKKIALPAVAELDMLCHVRTRLNGQAGNSEVLEELAVLICDRLPKPNSSSTVYLVSVDDRPLDSARDNGEPLTLVVLKSWVFTSTAESADFSDQFGALYRSGDRPLHIPPGQWSKNGSKNPSDETKRFLEAGYVPVQHKLRTGSQTRSWYHGPLHPGIGGVEIDSGARHSDASLALDATTRMLDLSYAAAFELGRWLTLRNRKVAADLYAWKRRYAQLKLRSLSVPVQASGPRWITQLPSLPSTVQRWFSNLGELRGVPLHYLVPDERMLPPESIHFFTVDRQWLERLCDGAFSIGRTSYRDDNSHLQGDKDLTVQWESTQKKRLCGCLVRSSAVSDWPDMDIIGWSQMPADRENPQEPKHKFKLRLVRRDIVAPGIVLCLFEEPPSGLENWNLEALAFQQKPESLHFAFDGEVTSESSNGLLKYPRKKDGTETSASDGVVHAKYSASRNVDIIAFVNGLKGDKYGYEDTISSAEFAVAMIGGAQRVWFLSSDAAT